MMLLLLLLLLLLLMMMMEIMSQIAISSTLALNTIVADAILIFYALILETIRLDISCESSARQTIHMKCEVSISYKIQNINK